MDNLTIRNHYLNHGFTWLSGNLHAHSNLSDGKLTPQEVIDSYVAAGHDFLALTDHDVQSDYSGLKESGLLLLPGNEVTREAQHILHIGGNSRQQPHPERQLVLDGINGQDGFAVLAHPVWQKEYTYYSREFMLELRGYLGIEIFNGVIRRLQGSPYAVNEWDWLLSQGRRVWGFATDDSHAFADVAAGWITVQAESFSVDGVMNAIGAGRFYASTGVHIRAIQTAGRELRIRTDNASQIDLVSDWSVRVDSVRGSEAVFTLPEDFPGSYVRLQCWGAGEDMAWSQPLWLERRPA